MTPWDLVPISYQDTPLFLGENQEGVDDLLLGPGLFEILLHSSPLYL